MDVATLFDFDTNNDNMNDSSELVMVCFHSISGSTPSQVDRLVEAIDEDGDSLIDLNELQAIIGGEELEETDSDEETSANASLSTMKTFYPRLWIQTGLMLPKRMHSLHSHKISMQTVIRTLRKNWRLRQKLER